MTLAGLLWAMIDWRSKRQRETPVIRVVDRENVQLEPPLHYPLFSMKLVLIAMITMKDVLMPYPYLGCHSYTCLHESLQTPRILLHCSKTLLPFYPFLIVQESMIIS